MEKGKASGLFANDGSFMEKFRRLQQEKEKVVAIEEPTMSHSPLGTSTPKPITTNKSSFKIKANDPVRSSTPASSGKLAFSLKQKSKLVAPPIKLDEDEEEDEEEVYSVSGSGQLKRQKVIQPDVSKQSSKQVDGAPLFPSDPTVKKAADKLASFVAKNGRQIEHITRQKNPGDTPFKFLFDESCAEFKYYQYRLTEEEKALSQIKGAQTLQNGGTSTTRHNSTGTQRSLQQQPDYQIPASALFETEDTRVSMTSVQTASGGRSTNDESSGTRGADPIAMMEYYVKRAAHEERMRQPKQSKDEMPPPASLHAPQKKGHHMGDYIPPDELNKFLASCNDAAAQKAAHEAAQRAKIQADNIGHRLLSKMGWKEGEGLGSSKSGIADPIKAGDVKLNNLGVGAHQPGEVIPDDDIYEQYKKRMMLGYRHRPNPMGNPRKSYY